MNVAVRRYSLAMLLATAVIPASASTDGPGANWALNEFGGTTAERQMLYGGTPGMIMATSPASLLFAAWRRLHGQTVPAAAGEALAAPCCGRQTGGSSDAVTGWLAARKTVPGAPPHDPYIETERPGPDYTSAPNCLDDAFRNATATLQARAQSYGIASPEIRAWVAAQDAVFIACSKPVTELPPLPDGAPDWLRADYRYQAAALSFYNGAYPEAAAAFAAIGQDTASPWHAIAPYLRVRALLRRALQSKTQPDFASAQAAAAGLPTDAPMHDAAAKLGSMAQLHADPAAAAARLIGALQADGLTAQAAADFKDLQTLAGGAAAPDALDWIDTFKTGAAAPPVPLNDQGSALDRAKAAEGRRVAALAHARTRYGATRDPAWLIAALALMQPDEAAEGSFMADAASIDAKAPAFLTLLYHRIRLTAATADPAVNRTALDGVLARDDLTTTTRNLFLAERLQTAVSLGEFAKYALRRVICTKTSDGCKNEDWGYYGTGPGLFDAPGDAAAIGIGDDARYLIDRLALSTRMALSGETALPAPIRMDIALTSFARAVLVHDDAAVDRMAVALAGMMPAMAAEFTAIPQAPKGDDKLFAEYLIFAKIPGLRVDLLDYTRPVGKVADFEGAWPNWVVLDRPDPNSIPPAPVLYDSANYQVIDVPAGADLGGGHRRVPDAVCDGMCGAGGFVPRQPAFLADTAVKATTERRFLPPPGKYGDGGSGPNGRAEAFPSQDIDHSPKTVPPPPGATFVWEFILRYAAAHPQDLRVPEALHWLVHVGHYGQSHDHSGKRAFLLLKSRYPASSWAKQNPFYYD
jgi:hypothetical protein